MVFSLFRRRFKGTGFDCCSPLERPILSRRLMSTRLSSNLKAISDDLSASVRHKGSSCRLGMFCQFIGLSKVYRRRFCTGLQRILIITTAERVSVKFAMILMCWSRKLVFQFTPLVMMMTTTRAAKLPSFKWMAQSLLGMRRFYVSKKGINKIFDKRENEVQEGTGSVQWTFGVEGMKTIINSCAALSRST